MECRTLDINIKRAKGLKNVNLFSTMDVYAVVSISGDPRGKSKQKTPVAKDGGTDPHWNYPMKFTIDEAAAQSNRLNLKIKLVSDRSLGDKKIGKVIVPIKQLLDESAKGDEEKSERIVNFSVRTMSGKEKGTVEFSYKFGEKYTVQAPPPPPPPAMKSGEPVTAYPQGYPGSSSGYPAGGAYPPAPGTAYAYPPPPHGYGYPPPPQAGYAYGGYPPPVQPGYGYAPMHQPQRPQKSGFGGMALGAGAGLLGGLLIGDMISDVGDAAAYDAGYDAGFGDGFDF
ncbi:protein SRC2 [Benincasa hispida]|uniref:protein SRC2 n=1 Tax=Benincasa hispida TaxID=102211 RepID=UPI001902AB5A|nr:protein SRC2 [Benincasa hispida]